MRMLIESLLSAELFSASRWYQNALHDPAGIVPKLIPVAFEIAVGA